MNVNKTIAENIFKFRSAVGISQNELAARLGVSPQAVSKWEHGLCCPDIALLPLLADVFGKSIDELFREN